MGNKVFKGIIVDWGGVLIEDPAPGMRIAFGDWWSVSDKDLKASFESCIGPYQTGKVTEAEFWERVAASIQKEWLGDLWWEKAFRKVFKRVNSVEEWLIKCKSQGIKIGFLSNTEKVALNIFKEQNYDFLDFKVFSCEEGVAKPQPEIFELILDRMNLKAEEVLFIDDRMDNIDGAKKLGIKTWHCTNPHELVKAMTDLGL